MSQSSECVPRLSFAAGVNAQARRSQKAKNGDGQHDLIHQSIMAAQIQTPSRHRQNSG
ncbi:Uncharacterised protein [Vibrio cholerae]|uniref:Uncharacterized protein n=1 Tax=Vibrio cholerae TaxID=666 RepID=A0A655RI97_VIBCL|nr:Uncharacterised protein [Vibrio cholerae]CSA93099.1 Uncharacterised protein [Vibrio cholerae]CSB87478.1 Uncharacterised protein [Vibrio cholerae]CSC58819.1 Uncharacterised protein [Vibrio cholerae]